MGGFIFINLTNSVDIPQSLVLRTVILGWILYAKFGLYYRLFLLYMYTGVQISMHIFVTFLAIL